MALPDVLRKSVTKEDAQKEPHSGTILHFMLPAMPGSMGSDLSPFWTIQRDWQLYQTLYRESQWANAISKAISKMASQSWEVDGDVPMRVRKAREMLMAFDLNRGWVPGLAKHLQAFLLTGNGAFIEIVHQTGAPGSKVLGLVHLDTFRCTRTGDPDFPVIYRDRLGAEHVMKPHQVMLFSDMPDQSELWYGVGHCAAERAYNPICRMEAIERFVLEKTAGKRPLALYIINGPTQTQIEMAIKTAKEDSASKGLTTYMGAALMTMVDPTATPGVAKVDLAGLPDGFQAESERKNAYLLYANAIGIDPQLLDPDLLASRAMGTGAQSKVISEKQEGIGLASWRKAFEHGLNEWSLDEKTTFAFEEVDLDAEKKQADVDLIHAQVIAALATPGILNVPQSIQMGVDWDLIPEEFLPVDQTPDTTITDYQKPEGDVPGDQSGLATPGDAASAVRDALGVPAQPASPASSVVATVLAQRLGLKAGSPTKTARARAIKLIEQERQAAMKLYLKAKAKASEAKRAA